MGRRSTKSLSAAQNLRARRILRDVLDALFDGKQAVAEGPLGISQGSISEFLAGKKGLGPKLLAGVASVDQHAALAMLGVRIPSLAPEIQRLFPEIVSTLRAEGHEPRIAALSARAAADITESSDPLFLLHSARMVAAVASLLAETTAIRSAKTKRSVQIEHAPPFLGPVAKGEADGESQQESSPTERPRPRNVRQRP